MTSIEILAAILTVTILIKLSFLFIKPEAWMNFSRTVLRRITLTTIIFLILTGVSGYYVFAEITIVEVGAVSVFISTLMALSFIPLFKYSR